VALACLRGNAAIGEGKPTEAKIWADRAAMAVESTLPAGHIDRLRTWNLLASVEHLLAHGEAEEALCRRIVKETQVDAGGTQKIVMRFHSLLTLVGIQITRDQPVGPEYVAGLTSLRKLFPDQRTFDALILDFAPAVIWKPLLERA